MIPSNLVNPRSVDDLMTYLIQELNYAKGSRGPLEKVWMRYHEAYRALPRSQVNNFPFPNSSNLVIPVVATDVDTIFSRLMGMYFASEALWTARATRPDMVDFAPKLEEFLGWAQDAELKVYDPIADWLLETVKLGTGILKTRYVRDYKKVYEFREVGNAMGQVQNIERQARILLHDHPQVSHVPLWNFYVPAGYSDLQAMPWCAEYIPLNWKQLLSRWRNGLYINVDRLGESWARSRGHAVQQNLDRLDSFIPNRGDKFDIYEFWLDWDIDGDGEDEAVVCTIHPDTRTYLRLDFNPYFNQEKPYDYSRYLRAESRFYGIGVGEMLSTFQDEISAMHNQRLDSYSVSNASIFVALKTGNIKQDEPLWPGRILLVDDINEVKTLQMGSPLAQDIQQEEMTLSYARQRTGVNDWVSGVENASSNYAAVGVAAQQLREGSKRIDQTLRENRKCLSSVGVRVTELYQQFYQGGKPFMVMGPEDGTAVMQILQFPTEIIRACVAIDVSAASASHNKEVELRTNMLIMQQVTQYYMQLIQAMQIATNPMVPPQIQKLAYDASVGGSILMRRILDLQGMQDTDRIVPDIQEALGYGQQQIGALQSALGGGAPMGPQPGGAPGVPALLPGPQGAPGAGFGGAPAGFGAQQFAQGAGQAPSF